MAAIHNEREHQNKTHDTVNEKPLWRWLFIIRRELAEAEHGMSHDSQGRNHPLSEILQVAATCVACLEQHAKAFDANGAHHDLT